MLRFGNPPPGPTLHQGAAGLKDFAIVCLVQHALLSGQIGRVEAGWLAGWLGVMAEVYGH